MEHNQNPLTLEQLRQMDGQPVWIENEDQFGLVSVADAGAWKGTPFVRFCENGAGFEYNVEKRGLKLHACKPVDFDKWEPCAKCRSCFSCAHVVETKNDSRNACFWCDHMDKFKPMNFCSNCGRPLTQDARALMEKRIMED